MSKLALMRLPLTIWGIFMATILALLAFPALFVSAVMMALDLTLGTSFFMPAIVSMGQPLDYAGGVEPTIRQGLADMWAEGPGGGHYENMRGEYTELGCGIYIEDGSITVVQDFR